MKYVIAALFFCTSVFADIRELKSLADLPEAKPTDTLFVFDIDNTLIAPAQTLGSDQWFEATVRAKTEQYQKDNVPPQQAADRAVKESLLLWREIQKRTEVRAVEKNTAAFVAAKQKEGFHIIGLTARPLDLQQTTQRQLKSVEIDLSVNPLSKSKLVLNQSTNPDLRSELSQGILFAGLHPKGPLLLKLFKQKGMRFQPKQIFFIDDKHKNVESVETALNEAKQPHTCFRYSVEDDTVAKYNAAVARTQLDFFQKILTDPAAEAISKMQAAAQ